MTELVERYQDYVARSPKKHTTPTVPTVQQTGGRNDSVRSEWFFETVRSKSGGSVAGGNNTYRSLAQLGFGTAATNPAQMPPGMIPDDDASYYDEEVDTEGLAPIAESEDSYDSGAATKGSEERVPGSGIGVNTDAAQSNTMVIRGDFVDDKGEPPAYDTPVVPTAPSTPSRRNSESNSPPPSPNSMRRKTFAERTQTNGRGTALGAADLGNGIDTIRPVKRVDTIGSLKLSAEYVGAVREGAENGSRGNGEVKGHARRGSENVRAGRAMIDEVVVPVVQNVSHILLSYFLFICRKLIICVLTY